MGPGMEVAAEVGVALACGVKIFTPSLGWHTIQNKCEPVLGAISLDAEISGCPNANRKF